MSFVRKNVYACLPQVERGTPVVLNGDPKGKNFIYAHGSSIVVRSLADPLKCFTYNEHSVQATVAQYAPSGFYICSADVSGKVRIWDTTQETRMLKYEYRPLSGAIRDLSWSDDSKRIVVCGEGKETFARAFLWDSGSAVGEVAGHSKKINSCDFKKTRPYRVITGSEDNDIGFFQGPPFKLDHLQHDHTRYVNCVRFSPNGELFVSGGADGKSFVYDGKTGEKKVELNGGAESAHKAGVYGVSWSPDGTRVITASADKTVKLWDVATNTALTTFTFGEELEWQQLGCLWQGATMVSVSLNGYINYLDPSNPARPARIVKGHNKYVTAIVIHPETGQFFAGGYDGRVSRYDPRTGTADVFGNGHTNKVAACQITAEGTLVTGAMDDTLRFTDPAAESIGEVLKCDSAPRGIAVSKSSDLLVVGCVKQLLVLRGRKVVFTLSIDYECLSIALAPSDTEVAVGSDKGQIHIYTVDQNTLKAKKVIAASGSVEDVGYSPDGAWLASVDSGRNLFVFDAQTGDKKYEDWTYHASKINTLAWSPDSQHIATGGLDTNIFIWSLAAPEKRIKIAGAHPANAVNRVLWASNNSLLSAGMDCCMRSWDIVHHV